MAIVSLDWATMRAWCVDLLVAAGLEEAAAQVAVENLVYAERRGFASHGFLRLPTYVDRLRAGGISGHPRIDVVSDQPVIAIVDAGGAIGAQSAVLCTDLAIAKAREWGVGVVIARNASHFGAAGFYTDRMAAAGFVGIAVCNTDAVMCAPFGGRAVLGTNPLSIAVPLAGGTGPQLDMATSQVAHGKIIAARDRGERIPSGWAVDANGVPTSDPAEGLVGALLPSGGPKGFGLAFMVDCLVAIGGARASNEVSALYGDPAAAQELGHVFIAIAVDHVQSKAEYASRILGLTAAVHDSVTPGSSRPPMVPGEPERQRLDTSTTWTVDATTHRQFTALSQELGVPVPQPAAT
jgi:LDH2 family malate/lactate/ureidoglycolate dehydrogenase